MKGLVARVLDSSFIDGPGHRSVVFMQGCDMACLYCHNPETRGDCSGCGLCIEACPTGALSPSPVRPAWDRSLCAACDTCSSVCPNDASPRLRDYEAAELVDELARNAAFIDGVTFSGGECSLQTEFLVESAGLLHELSNGAGRSLTVLADTNGATEAAAFGRLLESLDGFIFDIKAFDERSHLELTGKDRKTVLRNLEAAAAAGKLAEVRSVLVEGYNDDAEGLLSAARFVRALGPGVVYRLVPFRPQGVRGALSSMPDFPSDRYRELVDLARGILGDRVLAPLLQPS